MTEDARLRILIPVTGQDSNFSRSSPKLGIIVTLVDVKWNLTVHPIMTDDIKYLFIPFDEGMCPVKWSRGDFIPIQNETFTA